MSDEMTTQRLLGQLLEGQEHSKTDRLELRAALTTGLENLHRRLDALGGIPQQLATHEQQDERRFDALDDKSNRQHAENLNRFVDIQNDISILKTDRDMRRGAKAFAHALSAAIGAAVATLATLLRLKGGGP